MCFYNSILNSGRRDFFPLCNCFASVTINVTEVMTVVVLRDRSGCHLQQEFLCGFEIKMDNDLCNSL